MDRPPLLIVPPGDLLVGRALLSEEGELHLDVVMDIFIILKHDVVVKIRVSFMTHNPVLLKSGELPFLFSFSVGSELLSG